ncbi:kinase-like domain-containing protein [Phialemonium atrogriseum]|uniref:Kinase-like domain-containing protein n=1 Tax=Phialemonium atrogriseum TaxID=1093897 RepID=A0AAJ0BUU2_9PEZI|nr:kinase-like domain-containing protein [Phialemonium atrogriseum]KAK1764904.1 kinase-like domain-containing protein [Phialemonium atrogriseum]
MPLPTPSLEAAGNNINSPALYRDKSFEDLVSENQRTGIDGCGNEAWYISHSALKQHWEESEIAKVLDLHQPPIAGCSRTIAESYLRVWSILVFIGRPEFTDDFISANWDDVHLPMDPNSGPYRRVPTPAFTAVLEGFRQSQWPFFPVQFTKDRRMHKRKLDKRCVLPVVYDGTLTDHVAASTTTVVRKVQLQEDCTDFPHRTVVFKEYQMAESREAWTKEVDALEVADNHCEHIVKYFGSFERDVKGVVILEYANGGNLLDILKRNQQPRNLEQTKAFWESLVAILQALDQLHHLRRTAQSKTDQPSRIGCAHRDIKPSNILVFEDQEGSPFKFRLKLANFGATSEIQTILASNSGRQDNDGSRTYCKFPRPELQGPS